MGKIKQQSPKPKKSTVESTKTTKSPQNKETTKKINNKLSQNHKKTANKTIEKTEKPKNFASAARRGGRMHPKKKTTQSSSGGGIGFGVKNHQFNHFEQKRLDQIRERDERKAKKQEKILLRKKEHNKKQKILSKKNRKGQPIMQGRMELLLQKIQKKIL